MTARKFDTGKTRHELLDDSAIEGLARVLTYGAEKYGSTDDWRDGIEWRRYIGAARRHLAAFAQGEDLDESGLPHIDHAMACLMFLSAFQKLKLGTDDRIKISGETAPRAPNAPAVERPCHHCNKDRGGLNYICWTCQDLLNAWELMSNAECDPNFK